MITRILVYSLLAAAFAKAYALPIITNQPQSSTNLATTAAIFSVTATGTPPLAYQWFLNSATTLASATNADLTLTNVQSANSGGYSVVVTNVEGAATSLVATLTVLTPPRITKQPVSQASSLFADTAFQVIAAGDAPLSYQWRFNDANLPGITNTILTVANVQQANGGYYNVVVTNVSGSVTSQVATLTIVPFNALCCFGFSWTTTTAPDWGLPDYFPGHPSNGTMWPEFMSTNLGLAYVPSNNFAHVGASSAQIFSQVQQWKSRSDARLSLCVLWAGSDILYGASALYYPTRTLAPIAWTNDTAWEQLIQTIVTNNLNAVNQLYSNGARSILVQNHFDLSKFPAIVQEYGTNEARTLALRTRITHFNQVLAEGLKTIGDARADLRLMTVDIQANLDDLLNNAAAYGFTKTFPDALDDAALNNKAFTGPGKDYVFWDGLHPTSKTHSFVGGWNLGAVTNTVLEKLEAFLVANSLHLQGEKLQIGRDYTLQKSSDLKSWSEVQVFPATEGTNSWAMTLGGGDRTAYFRLEW